MLALVLPLEVVVLALPLRMLRSLPDATPVVEFRTVPASSSKERVVYDWEQKRRN